MSKNEFDDFKKRDTLSLFGDESRSNCTVAEAKAFEKDHRRSRGGRALLIGIPILLILVGALGAYIYIDHRNYVAAIEKERMENENPVRHEITEGKVDAKFVVDVQGMGDESLPAPVSYMLNHLVGTKPSEVCIHKTFSGEMSPKPLEFAMTINGQKEFQVENAEGEMVTLNVSNPLMDKDLMMKVVNREWNKLYPDAQYPLALAFPVEKDLSEAEQAQLDKEREKQERFNNIPLATDPRMTMPAAPQE